MAPNKKSEKEKPDVEVVDKVKVDEKKDICYRLLDCNRYKCRVGRMEDGSTVDIVGTDGVIVIKADKAGYDMRKAYMDKHPDNRSNGGTKFVELTNEDDKNTGQGNIIDELMSMSHDALVAIIRDSEPLDKVKTTGRLIMKILSEQGYIK